MAAKKKSTTKSKTPARTDAKRAELLQAIVFGMGMKAACEYAKLDWRTFRRWRDEDPEFAADVRQARAKGKMIVISRLVKNVRAGDTNAIKFWLLCRDPDWQMDGSGAHDDDSTDEDLGDLVGTTSLEGA